MTTRTPRTPRTPRRTKPLPPPSRQEGRNPKILNTSAAGFLGGPHSLPNTSGSSSPTSLHIAICTNSRDHVNQANVFTTKGNQPTVHQGFRIADLLEQYLRGISPCQESLSRLCRIPETQRESVQEAIVSPVSSVCLLSALCLCCTFSVFGGSSCPVSGKAHIGYKVFVTSCFCLVFDSLTVVAERASGTKSGGVTAT